MKILQITNSLNIGGAEKLVSEMIPHLIKNGIATDLLILKKSPTFLQDRLMAENIKTRYLTKGSLYNPLLIFKIIPHLRKYDLVHIHLFPALYWVVMAKYISFSKTKLIYTEHSSSNKRRKNAILKYADRILYRGISRIATISETVDSELQSHLKMGKDKFEIIHNGIDVSYFLSQKPVTCENKSPNDFVLIQVSSFRRPKDQPTLIKSLQFLPSNIKLLLVGNGDLRIECEALAQTLNLDSRITFLGIRQDVPELILASDVAVLSSHYEGVSLSSIEGMACKPFVATDAPGLRETVGDYGLLFKDSDPRDLAAKILSLYNDRVYYQEIAARCLERAKQYDIRITVEKYINLYREILKPQGF